MTGRLMLTYTEPLPPSTPRRDLKQDDRFDVVEAFEVMRVSPAGLKSPRLVSSAHGAIEHLMLWYPAKTKRSTYENLLAKLPASTRVTLVAHPEVAAEAEEIAGAAPGDVTIFTTPSFLYFSVWAEDACVVVEDVAADGKGGTATYLVEPYTFTRDGDQVVVDVVAEASDAVASTQVPLQFQGGNVLIGDELVLIGRDYLDETIELGRDRRSPINGFPAGGTTEEMERFAAGLFSQALDTSRTFHFLESSPTARTGPQLVRRGEETWVDNPAGGLGRRQPIFHIDMFVSLAGRAAPGDPYRVVVGDPDMANQIMGWEASPRDLQSEFDEVAEQLRGLGFEVHRSPLPVVDAALQNPRQVTIDDGTSVQVAGDIDWYHATSNNCLVQIDGDARDVWLPTYGQEQVPALAPIDARHKEIWEGLGFTVHQLADFHHLARASGALHCIKKYLKRGPVS